MQNNEDNIQYCIYEDENDKNEDFSFLMNEFENINEPNTHNFDSCFGSTFLKGGNDTLVAEISNYEINFTNKQLQLILEYYGLKGLRSLKKQDLISHIMMFEKTPENSETTANRKRLWYFMDELKKDKMMKRFILAT